MSTNKIVSPPGLYDPNTKTVYITPNTNFINYFEMLAQQLYHRIQYKNRDDSNKKCDMNL